MRRALKHLATILVLMVIASCAGGGGGCASCGMTPLPSGFATEDRIENAGAMRLTQSGVAFMQDNLGTLSQALLGMGNGGIVTFEIPESTGSLLLFDYTICPGGANPNANPPKCTAEIDIGNAQLQLLPGTPHNLRIQGPLPIRLQNLPIEVVYLFIPDTAVAALNGNGACPPNNQTFANIDLNVDISIEIDTNPAHSRQGYSRIKILSVTINQNQLEQRLKLNCGGSFTGAVLDALKGLIMPLLTDQLIGTLADQLNQQFCQQADPTLNPPCPSGTSDDGSGTCRYSDGECASIILGVDGHMNLGDLLSSLSPGTTGGLDLLFAAGGATTRNDGSGFAWGDMNPVGGGVSLGLYGGAEPNPISKCVPLANVPLPAGIPMPDELLANTVTDWPMGVEGPHVGIGISERFTNYALAGMYNSGLFCLGISTETVPLLNSGTLSLLVSSSKELALQKESQQIALVVRPQQPPQVTFGNGSDLKTDPLIRLQMNQASFDFYIWSLDRFIRFMTATFDLDVPVNLVVTPEGLTPVLEDIGVTNGVVTNTDLLREDPQNIADALQGLIGSQVGQAVGSGFAPINLNDALASLGLTLIIPDTVDGKGSPGLRKLTKGTDNFLGIFATLGIGMAQPAVPESETSAEAINKHVDAEGVRIQTMTADNAPSFQLVMNSPLDDGTRFMEYQYRVDQGYWHPFTRQRILDIRDNWLRFQGRHIISVRSRIAGQPLSLDPTPATVEVVVDVDPPVISVSAEQEGRVALRIADVTNTQVRYRLDGGEWSGWMSSADLRSIDVGDANDIDVEAKDEEGNLGTAEQALIRGRALPGAGSGCACTLAGTSNTKNHALWLVGVAVFALGARLRKRFARRARQGAAASLVVAAAGSYAGCSCGDEPTIGPQCLPPNCTVLEPGLVGAYTSVAVNGGTIWLAGYAEADWNNGFTWGDLVVGTWDGTQVGWSAIDGVPADPPVDPTKFGGFRGGQTEPGEDVGLWTSIAIGPGSEPAVAYFDRTNRALKFAQHRGGAWNISTIQRVDNGDMGRYAKLMFVNGVPVIAYLAIQPGDAGAITSSLRVATGNNANPSETDWSFEDVAVDKATPCREHLCKSGTVCVVATGLCTTPASGCDPECATGTECVDEAGATSCSAIFDATRLDTYPDAVADYIAMAPDNKGGFGLAYYDRIRGNLMIASKTGGTWQNILVDGAASDGTDTGDVGMGASLFIDSAGDWHLSYADGLSEALKYIRVAGGTSVGTSEVADTGTDVEGDVFPDGQHIIGDDSNIFVTAGGEVHITYQDATAGKLHYAVGTPSGTGHSWNVRVIDQEGFAGAFSHVVQIDTRLMLANWWRTGGQKVQGDVRIVSP